MEDNKNKVKLLKKILDLKKTVAYLQKGKHEGAVQYNYVSSSQVLAAVNAKMNEIGLIITTGVADHNLTPFTTKNGAPQFMTELDLIMSWVDTETGEELAVPFYAQGVDNAEKGPGKAATYGEKYFILKQLNIATDKDDPDAFQEKHQTEEQKGNLKAELIAELKITTDPERIKAIWSTNPGLKKDEEFKEAVKLANHRTAPKPKAEPEAKASE